MSTNAKIVDPVRGMATLVRPRFSPGLLLRDDDLSQGVDYTRDLSRLLFRSLFGCGVLCGLVVEPRVECGKLIVTVNSGVGLTCLGDPVQVPRTETIILDPTCGRSLPGLLWVVLRRTEKCCAPRSTVCSCDEEDDPASFCTRVHDGYEIRILNEPGCACACPKPVAVDEPESQGPPAGPPPPPGPDPATGNLTDTGEPPPPPPPPPVEPCWCADPTSPCYHDHYMGICGCECCDCDGLVLALLTFTAPAAGSQDAGQWQADHSVRRFGRPVLMRDPQVWIEQQSAAALQQSS